jgi:hypothetical protein
MTPTTPASELELSGIAPMPDPKMISTCADIATKKLSATDRFAVHCIAEIAARHAFIQGWHEGRANLNTDRTAEWREAIEAAAKEASNHAGQRILMVLGAYRDEMPVKSIEAFQELAASLRALSPPTPSDGERG